MTACNTPADLARLFLAPASLDPACLQVLSLPQRATHVSPGRYLEVFLLTCVLEAPFYLWALRGSPWDMKRRCLAVAWLNLATHPVVYFALPWISARLGGSYGGTLAAGEAFAWLAEAGLLAAVWRLAWARSSAAALAANLCSWWIGTHIV